MGVLGMLSFDRKVGGSRVITAARRRGRRPDRGNSFFKSIAGDIPIVDNEGSNFLCDGNDVLAFWTLVVEVDGDRGAQEKQLRCH